MFDLEYDEPPSDSGTLGPVIPPDGLTVTIGFGSSLFERYGLAAPPGLTRMPAFPGDELDPARTHGDLILQIAANHRDTVVHTLRELMRPVRDAFALRWTIDGFQSVPRGTSPRNLFGFPDGTANPRGATRDAAGLQPGRQHVHGRARDPHARRVLGPGRAARAGAVDRPPARNRGAATSAGSTKPASSTRG